VNIPVKRYSSIGIMNNNEVLFLSLLCDLWERFILNFILFY